MAARGLIRLNLLNVVPVFKLFGSIGFEALTCRATVDHRYEGVKRDFANYGELLLERGVILFHDVDPDHVFKDGAGGDVWRFWNELDEGSKTLLCCTRSNGRIQCLGEACHFGGIGIWSPR